MIYLDYAATTPMHEDALIVYQQTAKHFFGNANSLHDIGHKANEVLEYSRDIISNIMDCGSDSLFFTSGGTSANHLAIKTLLNACEVKGRHIIATSFEHDSIAKFLTELAENDGYRLTFIKPNKFGEICLEDVKKAICEDTCLAIIQHVNPEIGTIQQIERIGEWLQSKGILLHSDGVQAFGKITTSIHTLHVDSYSVSSHKVYGPKGAGAVFIKNHLVKNSLGSLEMGTMDIPAIASFATAAKIANDNQTEIQNNLAYLRSFFIYELKKRKLPLQVFTSPNQLPHIIGILFDEIAGDYAMLRFNQLGVCISTGSTCGVNNDDVTKTMAALEIPEAQSKNFVRLSLGTETTKEQLERTLFICENMIRDW